ncbi:hypothetical protein [Berryella intestinalis]|uniref:hypothetical protein n=1 Tax=Berryella intestinalis TaxID=1531429 RepID=UPI00130EC100|nr:hypothetical protein [Berryella intestinalis]
MNKVFQPFAEKRSTVFGRFSAIGNSIDHPQRRARRETPPSAEIDAGSRALRRLEEGSPPRILALDPASGLVGEVLPPAMKHAGNLGVF